MNLLFSLFLAIGFCLISAVGQASGEVLPLSSAVDQVLARSPGLRAAEAQVQQARAGRREARAHRLPQLSARSTFTRGDHPVYVFGSLMEQGRFGPSNFAIDQLNNPGELSNIQSALELGLPLYTGNEITHAARQAQYAEQQASSGEEGRQQALRAQTAGTYLQVLLEDQLLKALDERLAASTEELKDARRLKDRGLVLGSDYFAADAISGGLAAWRAQVQSDRAAASARLSILLNKETWQPQGALGESPYPVAPLETLQSMALTRRPDLRATASRVAMAGESRSQAGRSIFPRVNAFASLETNTRDFHSNPSNHLWGVAARLPFGDPAYLARRSRASQGEEVARRVRENTEESIRIEVAEAYEAYQGALVRLPLVKDTRDRAAQSLTLFRPLYRSGRQSIIEVLRAEEGLARAEAAYLQTLFQIHAGYLQLMQAAGTLDDQVVQDVTRHLESQP